MMEMNRSGILLLAAASFLLVLALALYNGIETVETDLTRQAEETLVEEHWDWVKLEIDGRNLRLSGEAPTAGEADKVLTRLSGLEGVNRVVDNLNRLTTGGAATEKAAGEPTGDTAWSSAVKSH